MTGPSASPALSVIVLAGGNSSRMGQDKALLSWHGVPLLKRVCSVAQQLSSRVQVLSPWPERYLSLLPDDVTSIQEPIRGQGPLWALAYGLQQSQTDWVLLLACDMPLLHATRLQEWRSHLPKLPKTCLAYVPQSRSSQAILWEPLCGFYHQESLVPLTTFLDRGGQSFQKWLTQIKAHPITLAPKDRDMFFNCNCPEDWSTLEKRSPPSPFAEETS